MDILIQQILNGLSIASVITLIAVGVTLIFGLTGIINFAHGEFLMVGSIVTWLAVQAGLGFSSRSCSLSLPSASWASCSNAGCSASR